MAGRLDATVAVLTGSSAGIGLACAKRFAEEGAAVIISDDGRDAQAGSAAAEAIARTGRPARYAVCDVRDATQVAALVQDAVDEHGRIDVLMNNAFAGPIRAVHEMSDDDWDEVLSATIKAVAVACRTALPVMQRQRRGSIINTSSVHGLAAGRACAPYAAVKAGIINLTRQLAVDYGPWNIRANALCPGRILTESKVRWLERTPEEARRQKAVYPLGRPGTMREAANAALFLACQESAFVTGHALVVDGGLTAQLQDAVARRIEAGLIDELAHAGRRVDEPGQTS
jgi:NAD(P)-dependent dehydrogenase (short-subunit alcohol dehydrogenase family)